MMVAGRMEAAVDGEGSVAEEPIPPRGGNQTKGKGAKFNGDAVCYHYNRAVGCSRTAKGAGCCNGNGGVFAHVCNHEISPGTYCLAKHPKAGNH